jgi:hypothetical protein
LSAAPELRAVAQLIHELHQNWQLHPAQIPIARALFTEDFKDIFVEAGRNFGKSMIVSYMLWRYALFNPGSENYYFAPYMKQAREILWASGRMQSFGPKHYIQGDPNNTEMRLTFKNGSFIKLDGSDNVEAYRGVKPRGLSVYDEFKDFRRGFHDAYDPNRAAHNSPLVIIGTPPDIECEFTELCEEFKRDPKKRYFWAPSEANPHIMKDWLDRKKAELIAKGEDDVWEREYMARFVKGGKRSIFPMFRKELFMRTHSEIMGYLSKDLHKLNWHLVADPGTITRFGALFIALNPYSQTIYVLDEIYESQPENTSVMKIWPLMRSKQLDLLSFRDNYEDRWQYTCDEAESWFINELNSRFNIYFAPTQKAYNDKEAGLSFMKDIFLKKKLIISDRCPNFISELEGYLKTDKGQIPKMNDHLIDCLAEGTLIETNYGSVPIDQVNVGDRVKTRFGFKRVTDTWSKGVRPCIKLKFSNGSAIECTSNHRIYTLNKGWIKAEDFAYDIAWHQSQNVLSLRVLSSVVILRVLTKIFAAITAVTRGITKLGFDTFIEKSINTFMGTFQGAFTFITKMATLLTTSPLTLSAFLEKSTCLSTCKNEPLTLNGLKTSESFWKKLGPSPKSGTAPMRDSLGMKFTQNLLQNEVDKELSQSVSGAKKNTSVENTPFTASIVIAIAKCLLGEKDAVTLVFRSSIPDQKVYDLTVEGAHEFFADGILVHNCFRYFLGAAGYQFKKEADPSKDPLNQDPRLASLERERSEYEERGGVETEMLEEYELTSEDWDGIDYGN